MTVTMNTGMAGYQAKTQSATPQNKKLGFGMNVNVSDSLLKAIKKDPIKNWRFQKALTNLKNFEKPSWAEKLLRMIMFKPKESSLRFTEKTFMGNKKVVLAEYSPLSGSKGFASMKPEYFLEQPDYKVVKLFTQALKQCIFKP